MKSNKNAKKETLNPSELKKINAYWRAANYLSVGQIYLLDNPLLKEPLSSQHIKRRLLGHWGTTPGLNFIYVHLNRIIKKFNLNMIFVTGPGHGGPGIVANTYLEKTYSEIYPDITQDTEGMKRLFKQFSFPGGIPSHTAPETPGSIHEGGELGYSLLHAYGAVLDNPGLIACCVIGDGEAETGPLAGSWHSNKFLNPASDGAVLPILHLNGYKIANPTVMGRMEDKKIYNLMKGYGYSPYFIEGEEPMIMHEKMADVLDSVISDIIKIQKRAQSGNETLPEWPVIILRTPKGWTGPRFVDGLKIEGSFRAHQVPLSSPAENPEHLKILEEWMKSYNPDELFDTNGKLFGEIAELAPEGNSRMGSSPFANGGLMMKELKLPDFRNYSVKVSAPGKEKAEATKIFGEFLRDVIKLNSEQNNFRIMGPDETVSNRLTHIFDAANRVFMEKIIPDDEYLAHKGRVMEVLSEHMCQGWLEGYILTGRHGLFNCYEAFIHIVDSMFNQYAKWIKVSKNLQWRQPVASLNYLLTSHVWRQDHNGFSHQDPGFIDHVVNKKADVVRVYLPPDANTLLSVADHCLKSKDYVNVIIAGKQSEPQYLNIEDAVKHCSQGIGIWEWASNDNNCEPDVVMACCGDVPTIETLAAVSILRKTFPDLKIRVVNIVDLMTIQPSEEHPHGLNNKDFDSLFTSDKPIIFAFHGYPWLIHRLTYRRNGHRNLHVRGYKEEGTTTTPFDMVVLNDLDRFHLVMDVIDRVPKLEDTSGHVKQQMRNKLLEHKNYIYQFGEDMPEIRNWKWEF